MIPPWNVWDPALLESIEAEVSKAYPSLRFIQLKDEVLVKGAFPILEGGKALDWYQLEIVLSRDCPRSLPIVRETAGRIPRVQDRHVNPADGSLCLGIPDSFFMDGTAVASFLSFLEGPVRTYLLGNSLVENGEPWPFGEWGHGGKGVLEYYSQLFGTQDATVVTRLLLCAYKPNIQGHWPCPCRSGRIFRKCHSPAVREVERKVPNSVLFNACAALQGAISGKATSKG